METKDYLMREIEKIGQVLRAIRRRLIRGNDDLAVTLEQDMEQAKEMLLSELNFELDKFLYMSNDEAKKYILGFEGFNVENMEQLAEWFTEIGLNNDAPKGRIYLDKALLLYQLCIQKSKTYSQERENKMTILVQALE